ncbi:unnamed protein product [Camellia sinensis]
MNPGLSPCPSPPARLEARSILNRYWGRHPVVLPQHLDWIFQYRAIKCATALLEGETGQTMDFYCTLSLGLPVMLTLAKTCNGALIELFIHHRALFDHRCYGLGPNNVSSEGKLPLNAAVEPLAANISLRCLYSCAAGSLRKDVIKGIGLLVLNTKEAELEICQYAKEGKVVELAALLMTAREKVAPILYQIGDASTSNGGMSIRQCIYSKLAALTYEESKFTFYNEKNLIRDYKQKKMAFMSTVELLDIFEMAGDTIETYIRLRQQQDEDMAEELVAVDFSWLLQGARLLPKYNGVNLSKLWALVTMKLRDGKVNDTTKTRI